MTNTNIIYRKRILQIRDRITGFLLFILIFSNFYYGYSQEGISTQLPEIIPPSPTVASLMKFEEIPVSNYTGIPDISIPIYNMETISKDLSVNVSLNYHPADIQISSVASCTGVGWSLFAGGSISRTVRGLPDELKSGSKRGIYHSDNEYDDVFFDDNWNYITPQPTEEYHSFLWDTYINGQKDTEQDIYQFNFMGYSGRFLIRKNKQTNQLYIETLDKNSNLKIEYLYDSQTYEGTKFIIHNDLGIKFLFEEKEKTQTINDRYTYYNSHVRVQDTTICAANNPLLLDISSTESTPHTTAFHLTKIFDNNDMEMVSFSYIAILEEFEDRVVTHNEVDAAYLSTFIDYGNTCSDFWFNVSNITPRSIVSKTIYENSTKKISNILIQNKGRFEFDYENEREDINLAAVRLKEIRVKNIINDVIKRIVLNHSYEGSGKRLTLNKVEEFSENNTESISYDLFYNKINELPNRFSTKKDYWDYYNNKEYILKKYDTNPQYVTYGSLQKMSLPSGGCIIFNFESNKFKYIGKEELTKFDVIENRDNKIISNEYIGGTNENDTNFRWFYINAEQEVDFKIDILQFQNNITQPNPNMDKSGWYFQIIPIEISDPENNNVISYLSSYIIDETRQSFNLRISLCDESLALNTCTITKNLKEGGYVIRFKKDNFLANHPVTYELTTNYYKLGDNYKYVYGGGLRIGNIAYFDESTVPQDFYERIKIGGEQLIVLNDYSPSKEIEYKYNEFDNPYSSSGSLVYFVPTYHYRIKINEIKRESVGILSLPSYSTNDIFYDVFTDFNNLSPIKTKGGDIGYKNVEVKTIYKELNTIIIDENLSPTYSITEHSLGKTRYIYTSAYDDPEPFNDYNYRPPFISTVNYDYKRGLILEESIYDKVDNLIKTDNYNYLFNLEGVIITGIRLHSENGCGYLKKHSSYTEYKVNVDDILGQSCGDLSTFIIPYKTREAFGWTKLVSKTTKNYFYNPIGTIEVTETFDYNTLNKKISRHTTLNSLGEVIVSDYSYDTNFANRNRIGVLKSITSRNGEVVDSGATLDIKTIEYNNNWTNPNSGISPNIAYLPETISFAKGSNPLETRLHYLKYDEYSNPLEVKQENGISIVYLWGYNGAYPIAKIENATYLEVTGALGTTTINEANLTAINALRTNPSFAKAMITTYTYKPLVGITSVTDPRGYTTTYEYDNFNRLKLVKDADGHILNENNYHYRPQN